MRVFPTIHNVAVSLPDPASSRRDFFNHDFAVYLIQLDCRIVLNVIHTSMTFQAAVVLRSESTDHIWSAFMECWITLYAGYSRIMRVYQESSITSDVFRRTAPRT